MADTYYSVVLGDNTKDDVTVGASTSSEAIELRVEDGTSITKQQLLNGLDVIRQYIIDDDAPA